MLKIWFIAHNRTLHKYQKYSKVPVGVGEDIHWLKVLLKMNKKEERRKKKRRNKLLLDFKIVIKLNPYFNANDEKYLS